MEPKKNNHGVPQKLMKLDTSQANPKKKNGKNYKTC